MKTFNDFTFKEEYKLFSQLDTNLLRLISLIDWKSVRIIFSAMSLNKTA